MFVYVDIEINFIMSVASYQSSLHELIVQALLVHLVIGHCLMLLVCPTVVRRAKNLEVLKR